MEISAREELAIGKVISFVLEEGEFPKGIDKKELKTLKILNERISRHFMAPEKGRSTNV